MSDNPNKRGEPDRSTVSLSERWEVEYWTKKFKCTEEQLKTAVKKVGKSADAVEKELKKR
jgi:hypothetical protein